MKFQTMIFKKLHKNPKSKTTNLTFKWNSKNNQNFYHPGSANQKHIEAEVFWFKAFDLSAL